MRGRCPFCERRNLEERLIFESPNFVVFPTKGQVLEGYTLIVPKRHLICLGGLTEGEMQELIDVKEQVARATLAAYGQQPIFFEHGIVGQSVKHAHMHVVPTDVDLYPCIANDFPDYRRIESLTALQEVFQREGPYLFYENSTGEKFLFHIFRWPQYLRIVLAKEVGVPDRGDWKAMDPQLDEELMIATQRKIVATFNDTEDHKV